MNWYALSVKSQHEKRVAEQLERESLESYVPLYRSRRCWSDRVKVVDLPLFSRYVFCRFDFENRLKVLRISSITKVIGFGGHPYPIEDSVIRDLKQAVGSGLPCNPWPFVQDGDRVRVFRGPLEGTEGILVRQKSIFRVVINVELLNRAVAVEVDRDCVQACRPAQAYVRAAAGV